LRAEGGKQESETQEEQGRRGGGKKKEVVVDESAVERKGRRGEWKTVRERNERALRKRQRKAGEKGKKKAWGMKGSMVMLSVWQKGRGVEKGEGAKKKEGERETHPPTTTCLEKKSRTCYSRIAEPCPSSFFFSLCRCSPLPRIQCEELAPKQLDNR